LSVIDPTAHPAQPSPWSAAAARAAQALLEAAWDQQANALLLGVGKDKNLHVRFQFEQKFEERPAPPRTLYPHLLARFRELAGLTESSATQFGRFEVEYGAALIDARLAIEPTPDGDWCLLQLLDKKQSPPPGLGDLGLLAPEKETLDKLLVGERGLLLVVGPDRALRGRALYALVEALKGRCRPAVTVEALLERGLDDVEQLQADPRVSFSRLVSTARRRAPRLLMIDSIRDGRTGRQAAEAALADCVVLAGLGANEASRGISVLQQLSVPPELLSEALRGILVVRAVPMASEEGVQPIVQVIEVKHPLKTLLARQASHEEVSLALLRESGRTLTALGLGHVRVGRVTKRAVEEHLKGSFAPEAEATAEPSARVQLVVLGGERSGAALPLVPSRTYVVGRSNFADLVIDDAGLAPQHARIVCDQTSVATIEDLDTPTGTWVRGERMSRPTVLETGDLISVGTTTLTLTRIPRPGDLPEAFAGDATDRFSVILPAPRLILVVVTGPTVGTMVPLRSDSLGVIGRATHADIRIVNRFVSRENTRYWMEKDTLRVKDLSSANGTRVNGETLAEGWLTEGDVITVGRVDIKVCTPAQAEELRDELRASSGLGPLDRTPATSETPVIQIPRENGAG
jgi:type II secretory ATPase GspE/PulE/Tfp pilus assembly ATPase PilB-like protein/pSer/pThr/pTyr-binding forkhead associated (FHA) protein